MEFRSIHTLETAENVHIKVELAGLANRVFAFGLDSLLMSMLMGCVFLVSLVLSAVNHSQEWGNTVTPLGMFVMFFGYHLFQEWLWNGKTVGKAVFSIRVVRDNGQPIGFWEAFGRNLLRVVDVYLSGVGLLVMMFNRSEKRAGDFVAGTIVINDLSLAKPGQFPLPPRLTVTQGAPLEALEPAEAIVGLRISPEEAELLNAYRSRRPHLFAEPRLLLGKALWQYFSQRWRQPVTSDAELDQLAAQAEASLR
jgi:uncharacterized RDD family membrane protein YckC